MPEDVENVVIEETNPIDVEQQDVELFEEKPVAEKVTPIQDKEDKEELEEDKDKEKDEEEEELELPEIDGHVRITHKQIAKEFPDFFKKFPEMRDVVGREHEFTEIFGGIEEARAAKENDKDFNFFSEKVASGDAKSFLEVVKDTGKADLGQFVGNFLPALKEIDNALYVETTAPVLVDILQNMYHDGDRAGNENLKNVALHAAKYMFNDHKFATGEVKLKASEKPVVDNKEKEEISRERQALTMERYQSAQTDVGSNVMDKLQAAVSAELPETLNEFLSETVRDRIITEADKLLATDMTHQRNMTRLWKLAEQSKFDFVSKQRIIATVINRYNEVIPEIRRKNIAHATKGTSIRSEPRREVTSGGRGNVRRSPKEIDWKNTSDEDLFSGKAAYKS